MARSHKDRHEWKDKERERTGKSDPAKIKLHRQRFLAQLRAKDLVENGYGPVVFLIKLKFDTDELTTTIEHSEEPIGALPYIVEDVADVHGLIRKEESEFDVDRETERLKRHVSSCKAKGHACHLEMTEGLFRRCESAIACQWRKWSDEHNLPACMR